MPTEDHSLCKAAHFRPRKSIINQGREAVKVAAILLCFVASNAFGATLYVRSTDGDNGDNGSTWALAKATLAGAFSAAAAGDTIYVSDNHAETQASAMTLTSPGTAASPVRVICVDDAAEPPTARATTATVTTTGANSITFAAGWLYSYGVSYSSSSGASAANLAIGSGAASLWFHFEACTLTLGHTGSGGAIRIGNDAKAAQLVELTNVKFSTGNAVNFIDAACPIVWRDTTSAIAGATVPDVLFMFTNGQSSGLVTVRGVDLSAMTNKSLVQGNMSRWSRFRFENCKLPTGLSITTSSIPGQGGAEIIIINSDSADTNYRYHKQNYQGTITQETTIVRSGGATDGTTPVSRKMVSGANSKIYSPLVSDPILVWNESLSSQTITVDTITDGVTLTDAEAWIEVEYLGTSGFPISTTASDRVADSVFGTPANQTSDSNSTWTTTGLSSPVEQELSVTFTPAEKGWFRVYVNLAKASTTMYYCPEVLSSSGRQWMTSGGYINEGAASGGGVSRSRVVNQ